MKFEHEKVESESESDKQERRRSVAELWTARDNWGMCCPSCPWWGEPHKPCYECSRAKNG